MYDILIKGGTIVDGRGGKPYRGNVAVRDGLIVAVGEVEGAAKRVIDAKDKIVTPGFVDIHTHFDGQASWDPKLAPSFYNGVTTVIMGNCGVGFAPVREHQRGWLIDVMDGVEEIPGSALHDGIRWQWESFPEYLDALDKMPRALDVGALLAHAPLRGYVMGDRAVNSTVATAEEIAGMAQITRDAMKAGAFGLSTSRTLYHRAKSGELVAGTFADEKELTELARVVKQSGHGILQIVPFGVGGDVQKGEERSHMSEMRFLRRIAENTGVELHYFLVQYHKDPNIWQELIRMSEEARKDGVIMRPDVLARGAGILFSFQSTNPFYRYPSYLALAKLPREERNRALRDPEVRARILADSDPNADERRRMLDESWLTMFNVGSDLNYEPKMSDSVAAAAEKKGRDVREVGYDMMLEGDCTAFMFVPHMGYVHGDLEATRGMLEYKGSILSGSDAGAHVETVCDGASSTFMLTHWARDRTRGPKLPLEFAIHKQTQDTANALGMYDRGVIDAGFLADINVIDYDNLKLRLPEMVYDLPTGAGRLDQRADGYIATIKRGVIIVENDEDTGARPGRVVRSHPQSEAIAAE